MKKGCRICHTAIFPWIFKKKEKQKKEEGQKSFNGDEVEEEEREPECEITAGVNAVNVSQSLKQSNITYCFK